MANLYPTFEVPSEIGIKTEKTVGYKPSVFFNYTEGDFAEGPNGGMSVKATGEEAWIQWCMQACMTQRGAFSAYDKNLYGVDYERILKETDVSLQYSLLVKEITESIMSDEYKGTKLVNNFNFEKIADGLSISFDITGIDGAVQKIRFTV